MCIICHSPTAAFASATILGKYEVSYHRCTHCGYVRTEEPYWLEEAYSSAITTSDVGLVRRNLELADVTKVIISLFYDSNGRFVDYAGGYGLFVRLMRDNGFNFSWNDKFCRNIFAIGFESPEPGLKKIELVTAFELLEHLVDPASELNRILSYSRNVFFSTELLPEPTPQPDRWWYYGLEHGQHVGFHTRSSLASLAQRFGLNFYTNGFSFHLFSEKRISQTLFRICANTITAHLLAPFAYRESLVKADFTKMSGVSISKPINNK